MEKREEGSRRRREAFRCSMSPFTLWSLWRFPRAQVGTRAPRLQPTSTCHQGGGRQLKPKAATSLWDVPEGKGH